MATFKELISDYAAQTGLEPKVADKALRGVITFIATRTAKGEKLRLPGLGTFEVKKRPARKGRNPQTGDVIKIKASTRLGFKPAATLAVAAPAPKKAKAVKAAKVEVKEEAKPAKAAKVKAVKAAPAPAPAPEPVKPAKAAKPAKAKAAPAAKPVEVKAEKPARKKAAKA